MNLGSLDYTYSSSVKKQKSYYIPGTWYSEQPGQVPEQEAKSKV